VRWLETCPSYLVLHVSVAASSANIGRRQAVILQGRKAGLVKAAISARQKNVGRERGGK
jgi:hypothetical protein